MLERNLQEHMQELCSHGSRAREIVDTHLNHVTLPGIASQLLWDARRREEQPMNFTRTWLLVLTVLISSVAKAEQTVPPRAELLNPLRTEHPRLLATRADFETLLTQTQSNEQARRWFAALREQADQLIATPPVKYEIPDGKRLLAVSRRAKERLLLLGLLYQLTGERKYAARAWKELEAVTSFQDWNPSHFLDTAEMTFAVAIGYDWMFQAWSEPQRAQLREAIMHKGFEPGLTVYRQQRGWSQVRHNWNQVCNGGLGVGALAIGDVEPEVSSEILHAALSSLPLAMSEFAPDGGWGEGPGYWRYATEYNVYLLAALETALGTDFGFCQASGFAQTGDFPICFVGPTGKTFNFADAHESWNGAPQFFWLAERFRQPAYAAAQLPFADSRTSALDLLWGASWLGPDRAGAAAALPLDRHFRGVSVVALRGAWDDPQSWFVACKGGDNRVNHGHLDLGTFVLDALGQRWAVDLGPDNYNLPGYFGSQRWHYFRNNTQSHNTAVIDGENQSPTARAEVVRFRSEDDWAGAVVDLSAAWRQVTRAWRGVALLQRRRVLIQDEILAQQPVAVTWQMLTDAEINIDGQAVMLDKGGQRIVARLLAPEDGRWEVEAVQVPPPQAPASHVRKLTITTPQSASQVRFAVVFDAAAELLPVPELVPLEKWSVTAAP